MCLHVHAIIEWIQFLRMKHLITLVWLEERQHSVVRCSGNDLICKVQQHLRTCNVSCLQAKGSAGLRTGFLKSLLLLHLKALSSSSGVKAAFCLVYTFITFMLCLCVQHLFEQAIYACQTFKVQQYNQNPLSFNGSFSPYEA